MNEYLKPGYARWFYSWNSFAGNVFLTFRWLKWCWQRAFRGWADCDWWGMDYYLTTIILPMLKKLRENQHGHPANFTEEKWNNILDDMIMGFEAAERVIGDEYYKQVSGDSIEAIENATHKEIKEWGRLNLEDQKLFEQKGKVFIDNFFGLWD